MFRVAKTTRKTRRAVSPIQPANPVLDTDNIEHNIKTEKSTPETSLDLSFNNFFAAESEAASTTKPWLRLERGLRLQKFRNYVSAYPGLSLDEQESLYKILLKANDAKLLNTKQQITYENGVIQQIKGLKIIRSGDPSIPAVFKIEIARSTKKNTEE